ncbi:Zinc finger homeobox protein 3 AT motif-binding factor 1 AT-binding transcription factor 1 [Triplophysa tibetana]|uniref:Zinc finger homeobox protein 3 AT motif-binding factor 1 AT-binding transcription factor 1 n=1 Tax=Triplophysa tibetana TaxID=1572043 RepID=A0A5A9PNB4_9TELE|nr:Zinc finger homeobox protein 3 AT motif-binding factor 1 AT-binding transcription factor 1 [Triplophysa tibetana]
MQGEGAHCLGMSLLALANLNQPLYLASSGASVVAGARTMRWGAPAEERLLNSTPAGPSLLGKHDFFITLPNSSASVGGFGGGLCRRLRASPQERKCMFRHARKAERWICVVFMHLQQHENAVEGESCYYHCVLCNYSTKAKLNLIQHVRSMKHQRSESLRKLQRLQKGLPEEEEELSAIFTIRKCPSADTELHCVPTPPTRELGGLAGSERRAVGERERHGRGSWPLKTLCSEEAGIMKPAAGKLRKRQSQI